MSTGGVPADPGGVEAPTPDARGFRRELTPTWLSTTLLLCGQRPPNYARPFRVAYLGSETGVTPAVISAVHPDADVWCWDQFPESIEATRELRTAAGLPNLMVHERPEVPIDFGGDLVDLVVVEGLMDCATDELRGRVLAAIAASLRPGGVACFTYKTVVGWGEIAPVQRLIRHAARHSGREPITQIPHVIDLLDALQAGGALYLTQRPVVGAWLDRLASEDHKTIMDEYIRRDLRPMSHAQIVGAMADCGCSFVGSATLSNDLGLDIPPALAETVATAASRTLSETYADIAVRRTTRADVFRLAASPLSRPERVASFAGLELVALVPPNRSFNTPINETSTAMLRERVVAVGDLDSDPDRAEIVVRNLLDTGAAHPLVTGGSRPEAAVACRLLDAALDEQSASQVEPVVAMHALGTALPVSLVSDELLARIGGHT